MRTAVLCAALTASLWPFNARAQSVVLTESEALSRLSPDSARARAIRAGLDVARVEIQSASRWPNPRMSWDRQSVAGVSENLIAVTQPLPITGRRNLEVQAATARVAASANRTDDEMRRLRADLRLAFADLQAAQTRERQFARARDRLRELTDVLAKREAQGDAAGFDRLRAEREVLDADADRAVASTDRTRAQAVLASFFAGVPDPSVIVAADTTPPTATLPDLDGLMARAEMRRGELLALRAELDAAQAALNAAQRSVVPEPEIVLGAKTSTASGGSVGSPVIIGGGDVGPVVGVHATIPLFDRAHPERALAAARAARAEAEADAFRMVLRGQVASLLDRVTQGREIATRYRNEAVNRADEVERIARISYDAGERTILELLDAYRIGSTARVRQAALDAAVRQSEIELEFTSGWEIP